MGRFFVKKDVFWWQKLLSFALKIFIWLQIIVFEKCSKNNIFFWSHMKIFWEMLFCFLENSKIEKYFQISTSLRGTNAFPGLLESSGFKKSSSRKWLDFQTNDLRRRAFLNQEKSKQRSAIELSFLQLRIIRYNVNWTLTRW